MNRLEELLKREDIPEDAKQEIRDYMKDDEEYKKQLVHEATHDSLTGLPNRALFFDRLQQGMYYAKRQMKQDEKDKKEIRDAYLATALMDVDNFKEINDEFGHPAGDAVLVYVGQRSQEALRHSDTVARYGGDENGIVLPGVKSIMNVDRLARDLFKMFGDPFVYEGKRIPINLSMGISLFPQDGKTPKTLVKRADEALYKSKGLGKNQYQFYSG